MWTEVPGGVAFLSDRLKKYRETFAEDTYEC